jgi:hypothetical protein
MHSVPKIYWLYSAHNILKTSGNMRNYNQENIYYILLQIGVFKHCLEYPNETKINLKMRTKFLDI